MPNASDAQTAHYRFCVSFVQFITDWNATEDVAYSLLESLSNGGLGPTLAIRQLHNVSLKDTLLLMAKSFRAAEETHEHILADHVEHFVEGFDRMRVYRNFYVHCLAHVTPSLDSCVAKLRTLEVKGNFSWVEQTLTASDLQKFTLNTIRLRAYGEAIHDNLITADDAHTPKTPLTSLQKPIWLDRLKKNRQNLLVPEYPPPPSQV